MPKIDQALINRGRALNRLAQNPDFAILEAEWKERIETNKGLTLHFKGGTAAGHAALPHFQEQYLALFELREWMQEEINAAAEELRKQQAIEQKEVAA